MSAPVPIDVLVFGAGVAGLWTLARLRRAGFDAVGVEARAMGSGQTIASQGIIHGGIKYALTGEPGAASRAIAGMPAVWRACLEGVGELDLREVRVLSRGQYLWTTAGVGSRLAGVAASRVIRTSVQAVDPSQRPPAFDGAPRGVDVYAVEEPVLEPSSLVRTLAAGSPVLATNVAPEVGPEEGGRRAVTITAPDGRRVTLAPSAVVLTAGAGNEALARAAGLDAAGAGRLRQQLRPLHMVMARGRLPMLYGHCVGLSDKPRVTITSQKTSDGETVWYVGGQIAENGVALPPQEQIRAAQHELAACVPWADLGGLRWATWRVDRAEGTMDASGQRPDGPMISGVRRTVIAYPTKLAFAPLLAARVVERLREASVQPSGKAAADELKGWPAPPVAALPWDDASVQWSGPRTGSGGGPWS